MTFGEKSDSLNSIAWFISMVYNNDNKSLFIDSEHYISNNTIDLSSINNYSELDFKIMEFKKEVIAM